MAIERVNPENVYHLKGLSATVKVGNTVHISGQVALDVNMNTVGEDAATQLEQIYKTWTTCAEPTGAVWLTWSRQSPTSPICPNTPRLARPEKEPTATTRRLTRPS